MVLYSVDVVFLLCFALCVNGCDFNDCICGDSVVICEVTGVSDPGFTSDELIETEILYITATQETWFNQKCEVFVRLQRVVFRDHTECPASTCVPCG